MAGETGLVLWRMALWDFFRKLSLLSLAVTCLVPVRGLPMPSRSRILDEQPGDKNSHGPREMHWLYAIMRPRD